jgi:hypothetical protein
MSSRTFACAVVLCVASAASASPIALGQYALRNHPDGSAGPPGYGLRLDELHDTTANHDIFTFDFNAVGSSLTMTITPTTIRIHGPVFGGRDNGVGNTYANDRFRGIYTIDFTYSRGVEAAPGDDDLWVNTDNRANTGTITTPRGEVIPLVDERDSGYSFRLGDEDDDQGHRGYQGISGWGWLTYGPPYNHVNYSDWLFTATLIPAPGAAALGLAAVLAGAARPRRSGALSSPPL